MSDLLRSAPLFGGHRSETWRAGRAAERRYSALKRALGPYVKRSSHKPAGTVMFSYPGGFKVPPVES